MLRLGTDCEYQRLVSGLSETEPDILIAVLVKRTLVLHHNLVLCKTRSIAAALTSVVLAPRSIERCCRGLANTPLCGSAR